MVLQETLDTISGRFNLQLFGTDIDNDAIEKARMGVFPASISAQVPKDRLKRFFREEEGFFHVKKEIRDCVVFSTQDILRDPPFPRNDVESILKAVDESLYKAKRSGRNTVMFTGYNS
ncbi:MAG: hypothetical protein K9J83_05000 [Desulfarculaceae bacterium]|nr:hypothetical protein [Desulfarculaceae bacterium]